MDCTDAAFFCETAIILREKLWKKVRHFPYYTTTSAQTCKCYFLYLPILHAMKGSYFSSVQVTATFLITQLPLLKPVSIPYLWSSIRHSSSYFLRVHL